MADSRDSGLPRGKCACNGAHNPGQTSHQKKKGKQGQGCHGQQGEDLK
jgi:hypothetical protein